MKIYGDDEYQPIAVDVQQVKDVLRAVVESAPDTLYDAPAHQLGGTTTCFYVHTDADSGEPKQPGCVVGVMLHTLGVPLAELAKYEGKTAVQLIPGVIRFPHDEENAVYSLRKLVNGVQSMQDGGQTWASALSDAASWNGVEL